MEDTVLAVLAIGAVFIGLPLLIVFAKDRGGVLGLVVRRTIGAISLLFGLTIFGWVVHGLSRPTSGVSLFTVLEFAVPLAMVGVGWRWLTSKRQGGSGKEPGDRLAGD